MFNNNLIFICLILLQIKLIFGFSKQLGNELLNEDKSDEFGLEFGKVKENKNLIKNKYLNKKINELLIKMLGIKKMKELKNKKEEEKQFGLLIGKGRMIMENEIKTETSMTTVASTLNEANNILTTTGMFIVKNETIKLKTGASLFTQKYETTSKERAETTFEAKTKATVETRTEATVETKSEARTKATFEAKTKATVEAKTEATGEAKNEAKTEATGEAKNEATTKTTVEAKNEAGIEARTETTVGARTEAKTEAIDEAKNEARTEATGEAKNEARTEAKNEAKNEAKTEVGIEASTETTVGARTEATDEAKNEAGIEARTETTVGARTEAKTEATDEEKNETTGEAKNEAKTEATYEEKNEARTEAAVETKHEAKTEATVGTKHEAGTEATVEAKNEAKTEAGIEARTETTVAARTEAKTEATVGTKHEAGTEATNEAKNEAKTEAGIEARTETTVAARTEAKTEAKTEATDEAKNEAKTEAGIEAGTETTVGTKNEARTEATYEAKNEAGAEARTETTVGARTEATVGTKNEARTESKNEAKTEATDEAKNEAKTEAKTEATDEEKNETTVEAKNLSRTEETVETKNEATEKVDLSTPFGIEIETKTTELGLSTANDASNLLKTERSFISNFETSPIPIHYGTNNFTTFINTKFLANNKSVSNLNNETKLILNTEEIPKKEKYFKTTTLANIKQNPLSNVAENKKETSDQEIEATSFATNLSNFNPTSEAASSFIELNTKEAFTHTTEANFATTFIRKVNNKLKAKFTTEASLLKTSLTNFSSIATKEYNEEILKNYASSTTISINEAKKPFGNVEKFKLTSATTSATKNNFKQTTKLVSNKNNIFEAKNETKRISNLNISLLEIFNSSSLPTTLANIETFWTPYANVKLIDEANSGTTEKKETFSTKIEENSILNKRNVSTKNLVNNTTFASTLFSKTASIENGNINKTFAAINSKSIFTSPFTTNNFETFKTTSETNANENILATSTPQIRRWTKLQNCQQNWTRLFSTLNNNLNYLNTPKTNLTKIEANTEATFTLETQEGPTISKINFTTTESSYKINEANFTEATLNKMNSIISEASTEAIAKHLLNSTEITNTTTLEFVNNISLFTPIPKIIVSPQNNNFSSPINTLSPLIKNNVSSKLSSPNNIVSTQNNNSSNKNTLNKNNVSLANIFTPKDNFTLFPPNKNVVSSLNNIVSTQNIILSTVSPQNNNIVSTLDNNFFPLPNNVSLTKNTVFPLNINSLALTKHTVSPLNNLSTEYISSTVSSHIVSPQDNTISPNNISFTSNLFSFSSTKLPTRKINQQQQSLKIQGLDYSTIFNSSSGFNCLKSLKYYCGQQAFCSNDSMCHCLPGFSGFPPLFPRSDNTSNSSPNLECPDNRTNINSKKCRCPNGFSLNNKGFCVDIDECKEGIASCGKEAFCRNLEGAYRCECPESLKGEGHECAAIAPKSVVEHIKVGCFKGKRLEDARIEVIFTSNVWKQFKGRIVVNGSQSKNPKCFKQFSSNNTDTFNFLIPANECNLIEKGSLINTLSTLLYLQPIIELSYLPFKHSPIYFIQIQCHFPLNLSQKELNSTTKLTTEMSILTTKNALERILDNKKVQKTTTEPKKGIIEKVNLKEKEPLKITKESIRTTKELIKATKIFKTVNTTIFNNLKEEKEEPLCTLDVKDKNGVYVLKIISGEELTLTLKLNSLRWKQKINNITIFPRKCYAINLDNGGRYCLTDNGGCAFERGLFPEWKRKNNYIAEAVFQAFRWTETNTVRFECDCTICSAEKCPKVDCEKSKYSLKHFNYPYWFNSLNEYKNMENLTWLSRPTSLPIIMEVEGTEKKKI